MSRCVMCDPCYARLMLAASLGTLLLSTALAGSAEPAPTCLFAPLLPHHVDAALQRSDESAPGTPVVLGIDTFRRNGMTCTRASCVANSCGDTGTVRIDLAPSADDATPTRELGYRLSLVRGDLPDSMRGAVDVTLAAGQPLFLRPGFDELPELDIELAAVAVDAAGNESAPTEPFTIRFDGCTLAAVGDRCEDELDPDTDLSNVLGGGSYDPAEPEVSSESAGISCSFGGVGRSPGRPCALAALGLLALGLLVRGAGRRGNGALV
jgi:hypothetical protein